MALRRARAASSNEARDLGEVDTPNLKITRTRDLRVNNLGGGMAERRREDAQREQDAKDTLRRLDPRTRGAEARATLSRLRERPSEQASGLSMRDAMSLAKNPTPGGLAMKLATPSGGTGPGGIPMSGEEAKKMVGNALIKISWGNLWLTFGHSIYIIDILFFAGWASKYLRQYIPEVGKEWFPGELGKKIPAHALLPIKLGEYVAMFLITFLVAAFDLLLLGAIAFILGAILDVARAL
ncbi:MAG: hypothetical protein QY323_05600 [Patescibacteria group bacterium]|nr:MAG: hypothetical protein QY323_05600 [Patescibacteria group bacterium]